MPDPRIFVAFAGRRFPVRLAAAKAVDSDGYATNVTCLHSAAGGVAYGAEVIVQMGDCGVGQRAEVVRAAEELAKRLERLGYRWVRVEGS